jgi:hypothetical protein
MFMTGNEDIPINKGAVLNIPQIIRAVMSSASEAKLCTVHQCQNGSLLATHSWRNGMYTNLHPHTNQQFNCPRTTHQQNYAQGIEGHGHGFHWLRCHEAQDQYCFYLRPWTQNLEDYWTKHHPASHHKAFWPQILTSSKNTATKSFVENLLTPAFVEQMAAQQQTITAKGA